MKRNDVILFDYAVVENGSAISLSVQVSSSMGETLNTKLLIFGFVGTVQIGKRPLIVRIGNTIYRFRRKLVERQEVTENHTFRLLYHG